MAVPPNMEQGDYTVKLPKKTKNGNAGAGRPKLYDWGDGKGRVHSRAKRDRSGNRPAASSSPLDYSAPLSEQTLSKLINQGADLRYNPEQRGINQQLQASAQRQTDIGGWYQTYLQRLGDARASSTAAYQAASQPLVQTQVAPGASPEAAAAAANQQNLANAFTKMQETQGKNTADVYNQMHADSGLSEMGWKMDEGRKQDTLRQALTDLMADKGTYRSQLRDDLIDRERKYGLDLRRANVEDKAFGLDVFQAEANAKDAAAQRRQDRREARQRQRDKDEDQSLAGKKFDSEADKDAYQRKHKLGPYKPANANGGGGLSSKDRERNNNYWQEGRGWSKGPGKTLVDSPYAVDVLTDEKHIPYDIAKILIDRARSKRLTRKQASILRKKGIKFDDTLVTRKGDKGTPRQGHGGPAGA